jgi:hypothetical protein
MANLSNVVINDTGNFTLPSGTTAQRPGSPAVGMIRNNTSSFQIETYSGTAWQNYQPTAGIFVYLWGGGGGGGTPGGWSFGAAGGGSGFAYGQLVNVTAGDTFILVVGGGGAVNASSSAFGGGGRASVNGVDNRYGSGGGGYTGLFRTSVSQANAVLMAGGGGGGGSSRAGTGNQGGSGGGLYGQVGLSPYDGKSSYAGNPGGPYSAGADASSDSANTAGGQGALQGGNPRTNAYGGGGGGGYWGGSGGGYSEANTMGGGGGGSGYINQAYIINGVTFSGNLNVPGGITASNYTGTVGYGGNPSTAGSNGYAVIVKNGVTTTYAYTGSNITVTI